ncbi:MAG: wax ester/triacylglycerol synthase family O-acyltransferase [Frankiaceae bacterium]|nr:wax ester/triacylglycerol synthase family O-acyltransferase [Frankiaceae bacterium]
MSGMDATFLYFETPSMHMHVLGTLVLDPTDIPGGWNRDRVHRLLRERLDLIPPFRRRLLQPTLRLHHPVWTDVEDIDLHDHITTVTCRAPGNEAQLEELLGGFAAEKLPRDRPLFHILVVEGLAKGRVAVVIKVHHCAVDGVGAARILGNLFDLEATGRTPESLEQARAMVAATAPSSEPGIPALALHTAMGLASRPLGVAKMVPAVAKSAVNLVMSRRAKGSGTSGAIPFTAPRASFNGTISPDRVVALVDVPLDDIKAVKNAVGGTFNDAVIAICGGAFRRYLDARGELPDSSLIAVVPVSVRSDDDNQAANRTSAMFTSLGTDIADPLERLESVRNANDIGKADQKALGDELVVQAAELASPNITSLIARLYSTARLADLHPVVHNVVISNVAGPPIQIYFAGAKVERMFPLGPVLEGPGLNITVVSYRDRVGFGLIACKQRMPDVAELAAQVAPALDELLQAAKATAS